MPRPPTPLIGAVQQIIIGVSKEPYTTRASADRQNQKPDPVWAEQLGRSAPQQHHAVSMHDIRHRALAKCRLRQSGDQACFNPLVARSRGTAPIYRSFRPDARFSKKLFSAISETSSELV
jgi:hypothetical protein